MPDCPGLDTFTVVGLAAMLNVSPTSTSVAVDVDGVKFESPLYCAVTLLGPSSCGKVMAANGGMVPESRDIGDEIGAPLE